MVSVQPKTLTTVGMASTMLRLLRQLSWRELLHHPWRNLAAVSAVMLGVALAFSVHLINASALSEFSQAVRAVNGQPDLELRAVQASFDEALYARVAAKTEVTMASPVLELASYAVDAQGQRVALRVLGLDALAVAQLAPALMPVPSEDGGRFALFAPGAVFLNPAARQALAGQTFKLQNGLQLESVYVAGSVSASGAALAVMDIGAAQELFGRSGQLTRIDIKLKPGVNRAAFTQSLQLPSGVTAAEPGDAAQRVSNLSRAYRVNLTVLALVALFTGAFLVFSVLSLSVAKRAQQFALLAVLGLRARELLGLVLLESALLGLVGSAAGIALGSALAAVALKVLGGDLGGGYFAGVAPSLQWSGQAAMVYGALGLASCLVGGWWPARTAQKLPPAQTLKGLGGAAPSQSSHYLSLALIVSSGLLAMLPPVFGIPLAAYISVALLLLGGIGILPWLIALLYDRLSPWVAQRLLPMLAVERARRVRQSAAIAVSGVVASLSLAVALTVMVTSFRDSVSQWLDVVLPADLYLRTAAPSGSAGAGETVFFTREFVTDLSALPGVRKVSALRTTQLLLESTQPAIALVARDLSEPAANLPLISNPLQVPAGQVGIYVSEAMVDLYGAKPGTVFSPLAAVFAQTPDKKPSTTVFFVAGVWRDYARQFGAIAIDLKDFQRLSGDTRINDLGLWLQAGADGSSVEQSARQIADQRYGASSLIEFASTQQIRAISLQIFDRSFAVTYWLQGVAIAIGLFGVAASFSAQVLARRKEFGLLVHLGLTRRQILTVVAGEGAAWTVIGSLAGLLLGLAVAVVLVKVVNPQSFHWTMDLVLPWLRLTALCAAVIAAGTLTAWLAARSAAGRDAVLAVRQDW
jgi:putative ABC transport system permease protein